MADAKDTENKDGVKKQAAQDADNQDPGVPVAILAQYVRDISFENPNTPESLRAGQGAPEMNINIGMDARKLEDPQIPNLYEVVLSAKAEARRKDQVVFIAEILYGVTVSVNERVPLENHHPLLLIEIPHQAFPHVRQILSDLTMQGGYPPLLLNPVDFQGLYMQRFAKEMEEGRKKFEQDLKAQALDTAGKKPN
ncbi:MAG: protein-export chaperone SecB [Alphaproteobacteria bacterium]